MTPGPSRLLFRALLRSGERDGAADGAVRDDRQHGAGKRRRPLPPRVQQGFSRDHDSKEAIAAADAGVSCNSAAAQPVPEQTVGGDAARGAGGRNARLASAGWCPAHSAESVGGCRPTPIGSVPTPAPAPTASSPPATSGSAQPPRSRGPRPSFEREKRLRDEKFDQAKQYRQLKRQRQYPHSHRHQRHLHAGNRTRQKRHHLRQRAPRPRKRSAGRRTATARNAKSEKNLLFMLLFSTTATVNSNCRLAVTCLIEQIGSGHGQRNQWKKRRSGENAKNRALGRRQVTINIPNNFRLSMGGRDYLVCGLFGHGGTDHERGPVPKIRIFVHTPQNCGLKAGAIQVEFTASANIVSTGYNPSQGTYTVPGIYGLANPASSSAATPAPTR